MALHSDGEWLARLPGTRAYGNGATAPGAYFERSDMPYTCRFTEQQLQLQRDCFTRTLNRLSSDDRSIVKSWMTRAQDSFGLSVSGRTIPFGEATALEVVTKLAMWLADSKKAESLAGPQEVK